MGYDAVLNGVFEHIAGDGQYGVPTRGGEVVVLGEKLLYVRFLDVPDLG